jgi:hypothetical protein
MSRSVLMAIVAVLVVVSGAWLWRACTESDEVKIQKMIETGREAIEQKSVRGVLSLLSPDYHDDLGLTVTSVRPMLQRLFLGVQGLRVKIKDQAISDLTGGTDATAHVALGVVVSGGVQGQPIYLMGTPSQPARLTLTVVKEGRHWRVREVQGLRRVAIQ